MKTLVLIILLASCILPEPPPERSVRDGDEKIHRYVERLPGFPGGDEALIKFISDNIRYPVPAIQKGIQGNVYCEFVVMKDGSISAMKVINSLDPLLDGEALRLLRLMPDWIPGMLNEQAVNVSCKLPIVFRLNKNEADVDLYEMIKNSKDYSQLITESQKKRLVEKDVFLEVDEQPEFPGGDKEFIKYLAKNIQYPQYTNDIFGLVICRFVVMKDGKISDVEVVRSLHPSQDAEAVRVLQSMPNWKPGIHRGQTVNTLVTRSVVFRLQS